MVPPHPPSGASSTWMEVLLGLPEFIYTSPQPKIQTGNSSCQVPSSQGPPPSQTHTRTQTGPPDTYPVGFHFRES